MKKLICLIIAVVLSLSLISCGPEEFEPGVKDDGTIELPMIPS